MALSKLSQSGTLAPGVFPQAAHLIPIVIADQPTTSNALLTENLRDLRRDVGHALVTKLGRKVLELIRQTLPLVLRNRRDHPFR